MASINPLCSRRLAARSTCCPRACRFRRSVCRMRISCISRLKHPYEALLWCARANGCAQPANQQLPHCPAGHPAPGVSRRGASHADAATGWPIAARRFSVHLECASDCPPSCWSTWCGWCPPYPHGRCRGLAAITRGGESPFPGFVAMLLGMFAPMVGCRGCPSGHSFDGAANFKITPERSGRCTLRYGYPGTHTQT